jgi:hypothetical protein
LAKVRTLALVHLRRQRLAARLAAGVVQTAFDLLARDEVL